MAPRSRAPAAPAGDTEAEIRRLEGEVDRLGQWQEQHDERCAERYEEVRDAYRDVRKDIGDVRNDIGGMRGEIRRLNEHLLKPPPAVAAPPPAAPASPPRRNRLEVAKDWVQIVFQIATGLGVLLWVAGGLFTWLGRASQQLSSWIARH